MKNNNEYDSQIQVLQDQIDKLIFEKEKKELFDKGILKNFENNILKDVVLSEYEVPEGKRVIITFVLNGQEIKATTTLSVFDSLSIDRDLIARKIAESVYSEVIKHLMK